MIFFTKILLNAIKCTGDIQASQYVDFYVL